MKSADVVLLRALPFKCQSKNGELLATNTPNKHCGNKNQQSSSWICVEIWKLISIQLNCYLLRRVCRWRRVLRRIQHLVERYVNRQNNEHKQNNATFLWILFWYFTAHFVLRENYIFWGKLLILLFIAMNLYE